MTLWWSAARGAWELADIRGRGWGLTGTCGRGWELAGTCGRGWALPVFPIVL